MGLFDNLLNINPEQMDLFGPPPDEERPIGHYSIGPYLGGKKSKPKPKKPKPKKSKPRESKQFAIGPYLGKRSSRLERLKKARARQKRLKRIPWRRRKPHPSRKRQRGAYKGLVRAHQKGRRCKGRVKKKKSEGGGTRQCFRTATRGTKCSSHSKRKVRRVRGRTGRSPRRRIARRLAAIQRTVCLGG